ncbi:hypothetical protein HYH03_008422 [Edaphochlamys debaryana]|uniref:sn-1-specific diacylglycerol lipase n=1 Tax=Edaphochlamys debaryana TaxID=47281 RepID=A0A836BXZ1_9CHLO|nr:hypothetical protein HYH03_008422 [Edaphochlamys debaryana]|eukprot:KAG2493286.1 hypothetical protein HYH03_008422 [Edaphochlamys debaryana]
MVIVKVFTEIFGGADMTVSDHLAALMLVGVRHRHVKLAHTYSNVPPPAWLYDGLMGPVGSVPVALGAVGFGQTASVRPPVVVELTASDRPLNGACSTSDPASTADAAAPDPGTGNPTTALASTTTSQPRAAAAGPTNLAPATPGLGSDAVTSPSTADATHDTGATAHNGNGSSSNGNGHALQQTAFTRGLTGQESGKALSAKSTGLGPPDSAKLSEGTASGEMAPGRKLTAVTSKVFGRALVMPNGRVPVLLDPLREWDGQTAEPNADLPVMEEALHYMKYATAVYGWMMYLWINRLHVTSWCRLCTGRGCGCCRQSKYFLHAGGSDVGPPEGCCTASKLLEREAITQLTGVADVDILYVCYDNQVSGILPYFIALDRSRSSVVIGIRGSMSLRDVVTDLLCVPAPYDVPGVPSTDASGKRDMWGHSGMVQCMRAILADVERQGVLEAALGEWPAEAAQQAAALQRLPSERARAVARRLAGGCGGWRLVITGHSLGAGVAGLLGPVLRVRYPNLRCWAFAPPGGLMSPKAAELTREFCISVVNAKDMVPRLGMTQMEHLVQEMVTASAHCRVPKFSVVWRMAVMGGSPDQADLFQAADELKQEPRSRLEEYLKYFETAKASSPLTETRAFVPPGHLLYVERHKVEASGARPCCSCNVCLVGRSGRQSNFSCRWISMEDFVSRGLVVSRSMFLDHTPDNTLMSIQQAYDQMLEARGLGLRPSQRYVPPWLRPTTPTSSPRLDKPAGAGSSNARAALGSTAPHSNSSAGATSFGVSTRNAVPEAAALSIVQEAGESQINVVSEAGGVVAGQGAATAPGRARDGAKEGPVGEEAA